MRQRRWLQRRVYVALILTVLLSFLMEMPGFGRDGEGGVAGFVRDPAGALVAGARVLLRNAQQIVIGSVTTDIGGQFIILNVPQGNYEIVVSARGFAEQRVPVRIISPEVVHLIVTLRPGIITESITVTAEAGLIEERSQSIQMANVIGEDQLGLRAKAVLAQSALEEVGVHLQRTSPTIGGVFIRGLTGNKINVYVDGVRYTTAAARGGINTFLNLVDPSNLSTVEILRGPRSADYGSDAIGGSLQLITRAPSLTPSGRDLHGSWTTSLNTADWSWGSTLTTSAGTRTFGLISHLVSRRVNTLRPGAGIDSHAAVTRFLGLRSDLLNGSRLGDTGFTQYGGLA
ncbi:MAG: TonB-dependent receptor plug domain-containing protein, partial [candidate division WOR-3 bacterium]